MHVFKDVSTTYECDTFDQVAELYKHNYNLMFDEHGSTVVEPEGFVLHLIVPSGRTLSIKYKFDLYYVAHKPTSIKNAAKAQLIMSNDHYMHIRKRLLKFATQRTVSEILNSINFDQQVHALLRSYDKPMTKKDWAMYWKTNSKIFDDLLALGYQTLAENREIINNQITSFTFLMKMFDTKLNKYEFRVTDTCLS